MIEFALVLFLLAPPTEPTEPESIEVSPEPGPEPSAPDPGEPAPAAPPNPKSPPSEGVHAVGSSGVAPLPPAPPPVDPSAIPRGSWRGVGWISLRGLVTGPIHGQTPGRPTVIALGGGAEGGWRIRQWIGLGAAFSRQPHEIYREELPDAPAVTNRRGYMTAWDLAFLRLYAPVRGRVDPYIDLGGGVAFFDPARGRASLLGGTVRASAGLEVWVARHVTLGLSALYRVNFVDETVGHAWQAGLDFGIHW